jgi:two-component system, OmpR family, response regulator QseB
VKRVSPSAVARAADDTLPHAAPGARVPDMVLDRVDRTVTLGGREVPLSDREYDLLQALLRHAGRVLTRAQLEQHLYDSGRRVHSNAVEVHVHHLRRKLGAGVIHTVRGEGYVLRREPPGAG